jgi:hypothetical protein
MNQNAVELAIHKTGTSLPTSRLADASHALSPPFKPPTLTVEFGSGLRCEGSFP